MNIWLETISAHPCRVGKYLICPINSSTRDNLPLYRILEEPNRGDLVLHYILKKAGVAESAIYSFSRIESSYHIIQEQDLCCDYPPPYRKILLHNNKPLEIKLTREILFPYKEKLEALVKNSGKKRTPFDKNFQIKQLYLSRIPFEWLDILEELSKTIFYFR